MLAIKQYKSVINFRFFAANILANGGFELKGEALLMPPG